MNPTLRFATSDPIDWNLVSIKDLVYPIKSGKSKKNDNGDYVLYGATGIIGHTNDVYHEDSLILAARVGSIGNVSLRHGKFGASDNVLVVKPNEKSDIGYVYHLLANKVNWKSLSNGTSQLVVSAKKVEDYKVYVANFEEQQKIAAFFTALDEQISIATRKCQLFKFLKKGIANSFFEDCALDCFKKIGTFARTFAGATPSTSNKEYWDGGAIPWMSSGEVNNRYIRSVEKSITSLGFDKTSTKMVKRGSTLIALAGQGKTRGKVAFTEMELCTNQSLAAIECDRNEVNDKYLFFFLETQYENLRALSTGDGGRGGLNLFIINNFEVPVISLHEQERIVSVLELIDKKIELAEMKLNVAERLKKAFMQQMFV